MKIRPRLFVRIQGLVLSVLFVYRTGQPVRADESRLGNHDFYPGDYSQRDFIGQSLPGWWRPFSHDSPWNTLIPPHAKPHAKSGRIVALLASKTSHIRFANIFTIPVWVVNSNNVPLVRVRAAYAFALWDQDGDGWTDAGVPLTSGMYGEPRCDGHICIIDPFKRIAWEMSHFRRITGDAEVDRGNVDPRLQRAADYSALKKGTVTCSTFNVWDLTGKGVGDPGYRGRRWQTRGGRGSGFPEIAGLIRPEEVLAGEIRHAVVFTFSRNRKPDIGRNAQLFIPPACRSDGQYRGEQYPIEGMLFQLDPSLTEEDFIQWGLDRHGRILARALQKYGMYLGDNGGDMALQPQLLGPTLELHRKRWEELVPGFYENVKRIPTRCFRIVYTGDPFLKGK